MNKLPWGQCPLSVTDLADFCWAASQAFDRFSSSQEYGADFHVWTESEEAARLVSAWWDTLPAEDQRGYVHRHREALAERLAAMDAALACFEGSL